MVSPDRKGGYHLPKRCIILAHEGLLPRILLDWRKMLRLYSVVGRLQSIAVLGRGPSDGNHRQSRLRAPQLTRSGNGDGLVPSFRSSHHFAACSFANFGIE